MDAKQAKQAHSDAALHLIGRRNHKTVADAFQALGWALADRDRLAAENAELRRRIDAVVAMMFPTPNYIWRTNVEVGMCYKKALAIAEGREG